MCGPTYLVTNELLPHDSYPSIFFLTTLHGRFHTCWCTVDARIYEVNGTNPTSYKPKIWIYTIHTGNLEQLRDKYFEMIFELFLITVLKHMRHDSVSMTTFMNNSNLN